MKTYSRGVSIIEMLVGITISLIVMTGVFYVYKYANTTFLGSTAQVYTNREARMAVEKIMRIARNANWHEITYSGEQETIKFRWDNNPVPSQMTLDMADDVVSAFYYVPGGSPETSYIKYDPDINSGSGPAQIAEGIQKVGGNRVFSQSADGTLINVDFESVYKFSAIPYKNSEAKTSINLRND